MEHGETADFITKMAKRLGQAVPDALANAPEIELGNYVYLDAFYNLNSERHNSQGVLGRIPWSAAVRYAEVNEFDSRQQETLLYCIKHLDGVYIDYFATKTGSD